MDENNRKSVTLDDLAVMVAKGFDDVTGRMGTLEGRMEGLERTMEDLDGRMEGLEGSMEKVEHKVEALNSNVNNYLELSEKRYSELKQRDALLAKWLKLIAEKAGVPIDVSQLEKI
jgi:predicted  nucleic acid-binding Zn-ribbon protein